MEIDNSSYYPVHSFRSYSNNMNSTMSEILSPSDFNPWYFLVDLLMICSPLIPYIFQCLEIIRIKSASGFSTLVCWVLIIANIARIYFWMGEPFGIALLLTAICMLVAQLLLLRICTGFNYLAARSPLPKTPNTLMSKLDTKYSLCLLVILFFSLLLLLLQHSFGHSQLYLHSLGTFSAMVEACLALPQVLKNYQNKSTRGVTNSIIFGWALGDLAKLFYYIAKGTPLQLRLCAIFQFSTDMLILFQYIRYTRTEKITTHITKLQV